MYILSAITGTDQVGQAFQKVNSNLNKQIVSGNTSGQVLNLISKDGTQESISLSSVTSGYATTQALNSFLPVSSSTYFRASGGTITGPVTITDNSGIYGIVISGGQNTIRFTDDFNATNINLIADTSAGGDYDINLRAKSGDIVIIDPTPVNQIIKTNNSGDGFDYLDIVAGSNIGITKSGGTWTISAATSTNGITTATTVGTGISPISSITSNNLRLKSISGGPNTTVYENNGTIFISSTTQSTNGITGSTTVGAGTSLISSVTSTNINFKSISAGTNINFVDSNGNITINSSAGSGGGVSGITSLSGINPLSSITNNNIVQKGFTGGTGISITEANGLITITNSGSGTGTLTGSTSVGGGQDIVVSASPSTITFKTISGQSGIETTTVGNLIIVRPTTRTANRVYITDASGIMTSSSSLQTDNTNGTLGIGVAASTTTRLLLPAQTATISPFRFTQSSQAITSPANGDIWYLTAGDSLKFRKGSANTTDFIFKDNNLSLSGTSNNRVLQADSGGTLSALAGITNFGIFNSITSVTVNNTTGETSLLNTGSTVLIGTNVLNSSSHITQPMLVIGKKFRYTAKGSITTKSSAAGTLNVKAKLGSSIICTSSAFTLANNVNTPNVFSIELTFTVRSQGASGTVISSGLLHCSTAFHTGSQDCYGLFDQGSVTIDTTTDKIFDITAQWSVADSTNLITITESTLEFLN